MVAADQVDKPLAPVSTESVASAVGLVILTLVAAAVASGNDGAWLTLPGLIAPAVAALLLGADMVRNARRLALAAPVPESVRLDSPARTWARDLIRLAAVLVPFAFLADWWGWPAVLFIGSLTLLATLRVAYVGRLERHTGSRFYRERKFWTWDPQRFYRSGA